jgi:tRNA dimethylallyltransferase
MAIHIHAHDVQKLVRAMELCLLSRQPLSRLYAAGRDALEGYSILKMGLDPPRRQLYDRVNRRCEQMFAGGLVEEVRGILSRGYPPGLKPLEAHGYRQAVQYLEGELTLEQAIESACLNTRRYAKRQWTWFRRDREIHWLPGFGDDPEIREKALRLVGQFLVRFSAEERN